jgi:hypothetical protein
MAVQSDLTETKKTGGEEQTACRDPLIVDLGRRSKRLVDRLRKGRGELMDEVDDCLEELVTASRVAESAQPVIIVVAEKAKALRPMLIPPGIPIPFAEEEDEDEDEDEDDEDDEDEDDE